MRATVLEDHSAMIESHSAGGPKCMRATVLEGHCAMRAIVLEGHSVMR